MVFVTVLLALASLHQSTPADSNGPTESGSWEKLLTSIAEGTNGSLVFDVPDALPPSEVPKEMQSFALDVLSQLYMRTRLEVDGVSVCVRRQPDQTGHLGTSPEQLLAALTGLDPQDLTELVTDGIDVGDLPDFARRQLLINLPMQLGDAVRAEGGGQMKVALDVNAEYSFVDPNTGKSHKGLLSGSRFGGWMFPRDGDSKPTPSIKGQPQQTSAPEKPLDGPLDFGSGKIVTLKDAVAKAQDAFSTYYFYDSRLKDSRYFFSGKFTKKRFEDVLKDILKVVPLTESESPANVDVLSDLSQEIRKILADKDSAFSKDGEMALNRGSMDGSELAATSDQFAQILKSLGVSGNNFKVSLKPAMYMSVYMPGKDGSPPMSFVVKVGDIKKQ